MGMRTDSLPRGLFMPLQREESLKTVEAVQVVVSAGESQERFTVWPGVGVLGFIVRVTSFIGS